jgi:hypothetical protein
VTKCQEILYDPAIKKNLVRVLVPLLEFNQHWLDWFHITMRLTVMGQYVKGLTAELRAADKKPIPSDGDEADERIDAADIAQRLERLKWNLWHGNVRRALQLVDLLEEHLEIDGAAFENGRKH